MTDESARAPAKEGGDVEAGNEAPAPDWSFVIPCLNEQEFLPETLQALALYVPKQVAYEVVVVDHGSADQSVEIARSHGARVIVAPGLTLGALRNRGAREARGEVLLYLDADISLTPRWSEHVEAAIAALSRTETDTSLTGSMPIPDPSASWAGRHWESGRRTEGPVSALGGGHMIIRRDDFFRVGGFPLDVDAGEDEELCTRIRDSGGTVFADPGLEVVHRGAPSSVSAFLHRQFWHGLGDAKSLGRLLRSRTALLSGCFLLMHVLLAITFFRGGPSSYLVGPMAAVVIAIPAAAALRRLGASWNPLLLSLFALYWLCFLARGAAILARPFGMQRRRRRAAMEASGPPATGRASRESR